MNSTRFIMLSSVLLWLTSLSEGWSDSRAEKNVPGPNIAETLTRPTDQAAASQAILEALRSLDVKLDNLESKFSLLLKEKAAAPEGAKPSNCADILRSGQHVSGVYTVTVFSTDIQVCCDMDTDGGGWTVFQRREDVVNHTDFFRVYSDYQAGFGDLRQEFWLGLDRIYLLTSASSMTLRVDLEDFEGARRHAEYRRFLVGSPENKFRLFVEGYSGNAGDSLTPHNGHGFSAKDQDNDTYGGNCALQFSGAWWYTKCHSSNLNGKYLGGPHTSHADGVNWLTMRGHKYSLRKTEMKLRPVSFRG